MGVCLSKGHGGHHRGRMLISDDEGFCTPEGVSSQYESHNPSGRYSFAHLETPRISADVGDLGALGSLFYKRGSRSRDTNTNTTMLPIYISPLEMFLGGVSGRNRVHHLNQICMGDYSFPSYLASPLLKGFDVHAMEAVAKSYAESAAKAAARDAFVFLEENDISLFSTSGCGFQAVDGLHNFSPSFLGAAVREDSVDDLAKSGGSEEWEEPTRKIEHWKDEDEALVAENNAYNKSAAHRVWESNLRVTNERWVSVLNAVQARAKARRRQRRKSVLGKTLGEGIQCSGKKKTVRFRLAGVEEGFIDDGIRSRKESEIDQAPQRENQAPGDFTCVVPAACTTTTTTDDVAGAGDECVQYVEEISVEDERLYAAGAAASAAEEGNYHIWQDDEEEEEIGGEEGRYGKEKIIEAEFLGFTSAGGPRVFDGGVPSPYPPGGPATPLMGPGSALLAPKVGHVQHLSLESFSSSEYILPDTSFGCVDELEDEVLDGLTLPPGLEDEADEAMSSANYHADGLRARQEDEEGTFRGRGGDSRQSCSADCDECEAAALCRPRQSGCGDGSSSLQEMPLSLFMKDISVSDDTGAGLSPAIPVGCVVVESRMPDGSRLTPQILELSEVDLPVRGEDNYGIFHTRVVCPEGSSAPSGPDPNSEPEGGFSFPVLFQPYSSFAIPSPDCSSGRDETRRADGLWRASPLGNPETPIRNRSIRPHLPSLQTLLGPSMSKIRVHQVHAINSTLPKRSIFYDNGQPSCDPRRRFSFDTQLPLVTKRTREIVLPTRIQENVFPTLNSRSLSPTPVFSPSKVAPIQSLRSAHLAAAAVSSSFLPSIQFSSIPYPPKARRTLNKKLKFYSLERASYAAAVAKKSKSPPSLGRQCKERRRDTDGEFDSDLFEIETMSGTNAMGSSRTPPSTPTKCLSKWTPPAVASFDLDKLADSIARVSRSMSKRAGEDHANGKPTPTVQLRDSKARCLPVERRRSSTVFQGRGTGTAVKSKTRSSLKGRALLKLGLLMRSSKPHPHIRSDFGRDSEPFRSSETSASEYLENRPPSPAGRFTRAQCGNCLVEEEWGSCTPPRFRF